MRQIEITLKKQVIGHLPNCTLLLLTHVYKIRLIKFDKIECFGAEDLVSFCADVTPSLDFRKKSKKMRDTLFSADLPSHVYDLPLTSLRRPTTVKNSTTTHINHDDNQPEIAFARSYTELVAIVPSVVAVASTIAPRSRLLSLHFHRLIAAAESTDLGSSAA